MSKQIEDGGPAFPVNQSEVCNTTPGLSLRDYFAAHAPPAPEWYSRRYMYGADPKGSGLVGKDVQPASMEEQERHFHAWRWHYADAMLAARKAGAQ